MGRKLKTVNTKNTEKSPIHENAGVNITCDFGDSDISRQTCVPSVSSVFVTEFYPEYGNTDLLF